MGKRSDAEEREARKAGIIVFFQTMLGVGEIVIWMIGLALAYGLLNALFGIGGFVFLVAALAAAIAFLLLT